MGRNKTHTHCLFKNDGPRTDGLIICKQALKISKFRKDPVEEKTQQNRKQGKEKYLQPASRSW